MPSYIYLYDYNLYYSPLNKIIEALYCARLDLYALKIVFYSKA